MDEKQEETKHAQEGKKKGEKKGEDGKVERSEEAESLPHASKVKLAPTRALGAGRARQANQTDQRQSQCPRHQVPLATVCRNVPRLEFLQDGSRKMS